MPRYQYRCNICDRIATIFHLSDEVATDCPYCNAKESLAKVLTQFHTGLKTSKKQKVGKVTEQFIEDSRQELEQQKNKLNKDR
jgi:putative FmdB family regulatory protein